MSKGEGFSRRHFFRNSALGVLGAGLAGQGTHLMAGNTSPKETPKVRAFRTLGRTGFNTSEIGRGGVAKVEVINVMLDAGVNYIDTAESYSRGKSEISFGQAIKNRDRKSLFINTKLHIKENETKEAILERARKCLERLDTEYIDCLMTHNPPTIEMVKYAPFHEAVKQLKSEGNLKFTGISHHGTQFRQNQETMDKVLLAAAEDGRFAVMLLVYNFIQREMAERILNACREKNVGATLMKTNPVGRYLSTKARMETMQKEGKEISQRFKDRLARGKEQYEKGEYFLKKYNLKDPTEIRIAATRFGLSNPGTACVLARVDSFEDVEQFLSVSGTTLSDMEARKLSAWRRGFGSFYCRHACGECESSCPHQVPVNTIMRYNHYFEAQGQQKYAMEKYASLDTPKADLCETCSGPCQSDCPYGVPIQVLLAMAHENLSL